MNHASDQFMSREVPIAFGAISINEILAVCGTATYMAVAAGLTPQVAAALTRSAVHDTLCRRSSTAAPPVVAQTTFFMDVSDYEGFEVPNVICAQNDTSYQEHAFQEKCCEDVSHTRCQVAADQGIISSAMMTPVDEPEVCGSFQSIDIVALHDSAGCATSCSSAEPADVLPGASELPRPPDGGSSAGGSSAVRAASCSSAEPAEALPGASELPRPPDGLHEGFIDGGQTRRREEYLSPSFIKKLAIIGASGDPVGLVSELCTVSLPVSHPSCASKMKSGGLESVSLLAGLQSLALGAGGAGDGEATRVASLLPRPPEDAEQPQHKCKKTKRKGKCDRSQLVKVNGSPILEDGAGEGALNEGLPIPMSGGPMNGCAKCARRAAANALDPSSEHWIEELDLIVRQARLDPPSRCSKCDD